MAGPPPTSGRIKKGEVRNPRGRSDKVRALSKIRRMTGADLADLVSLMLTGDFAKVQAVVEDEKSTAMQRLTAKLIIDCYNRGDVTIYRALLDRVVGKPKESQSIEISTPPGSALQFAHLSDAELDAQISALKARDKDAGTKKD